MDSALNKLALFINNMDPSDLLGANAYRSTMAAFRGHTDGPSGNSSEPPQVTEVREAGARCQRMIENPNEPCPIPRINLTLADLDPDYWSFTQHAAAPPLNYKSNDMAALGVPTSGYQKMMLDGFHESSGDVVSSWRGRAAQGALFIEDIERKPGSGPWISELCKVAYEQVAPLATLQKVFATNVINSETRPFARGVWVGSEVEVFEAGSRQFHTLLGTRIGKTVAYFILGAYGQGNRRIARIAIWWSGQTTSVLQMRFDIV
jgi:hypothetical protein